LRPASVIVFPLPGWIETMEINTAACIAGLGAEQSAAQNASQPGWRRDENNRQVHCHECRE